MHFLRNRFAIHLYVATYFAFSSCSGINENEGDVMKDMRDGIRSFNARDTQLSNCTCVDTLQCKNIPKQTPRMVEQCSITENICCFTDDIESSALMNLLLGPTTIVKSEAEEETFDNCACFTEGDCIEHHGIVSTFGPNSPSCPDSSFICCLLNVDEASILAAIFGIPEPIPDENVESDKCRCVPEEQCNQNLSAIVNVRSSISNSCGNLSAICCPEKYIEVKVPIEEETIEEECRCVAQKDCIIEPHNIGLIVDVRRQAKLCQNVQEICCPTDKINTLAVKQVIITDQKDACTCVSLNRCKSSSKNLSLLVDVRSQTCKEPLSICCFPEDVLSPKVSSQPERKCACIERALCDDEAKLPDHRTMAARCIGTEVCCTNPKEFEHSLSCGQSHESNARIDIRVSLGHQAQFAEFPWMVAIFETDDNGSHVYKCGGSLIHPSIVLTTAHCINDDSGKLLKVRAGDWDITSEVEKMASVEKYVTSRILHPEFSARSLRHNIGLLYLDTSIRLQHHINTICLPTTQDFAQFDPFCTATGWGNSVFNNSKSSQTTLKKVDLPIVDSGRCQTALRTTRLGDSFKLDSTAICAGGTRQDTCTGDGGSPLVCLMTDGSNRYVQVGAVAWGIGCGDLKIPGVYASTFTAIDWIRKVVANDFGDQAVKYFT